MIEKAGLRFLINCPTIDEHVYVDRDLWEKIVFNLLSNAFKFTFAGEIEIELRKAGNAVELMVRDTGTGIPAEDVPHLFERFYRVKNAHGRTFEGSGIGLALVQELAKLHGGSVGVESKMGSGSTFTVSVPLGSAHLPADRIGAERSLSSTSLNGETYVEEASHWLPDLPATEVAVGPLVPSEKTGGIGLSPKRAQM
jgi:signal transduction histidine kinase